MERGDPITWAVPPPAYVPPKNEATEKSKPVPVAGSPVRTLNDPPYEQENIVVNSSTLTVQKTIIFFLGQKVTTKICVYNCAADDPAPRRAPKLSAKRTPSNLSRSPASPFHPLQVQAKTRPSHLPPLPEHDRNFYQTQSRCFGLDLGSY